MNSAAEAGMDGEQFERNKRLIIAFTVINLLGAVGFALYVLL